MGEEVARPGGATSVTFRTRDGWSLTGDLAAPSGEPWAVALLAPAMGVARRFYRPLAEHLAGCGVAALVPDYRGMGDSHEAPAGATEIDLVTWGERDLPAAMETLAARWPGVPRVWIGHSVGGQLLGLYAGPEIHAALLVASQSGHWRHWDGGKRLGMAFLWHAGIPLATTAFGRLPMRLLGQGEDVPRGVAREWARWGRHRDYILSEASPRGGLHFAHYAGPLRSYAILDDAYAPRRAVEALAAGFTGTSPEVRAISPRDLGLRAIGHFGFFRPATGKALWTESVDWLRAAVGRPG